jgi:hypothetical protein
MELPASHRRECAPAGVRMVARRARLPPWTVRHRSISGPARRSRRPWPPSTGGWRRAGTIRGAGRFMPHVTLKGLFRTRRTPFELERRVAAALAGRAPIALHQACVRHSPPTPSSSMVDGDGAGGATRSCMPCTSRCSTRPRRSWSDRFAAEEHVRDAFPPTSRWPWPTSHRRASRRAGRRALARAHRPRVSTAAGVQLAVFESADWSGRWWETMTWRVVVRAAARRPVSQA